MSKATRSLCQRITEEPRSLGLLKCAEASKLAGVTHSALISAGRRREITLYVYSGEVWVSESQVLAWCSPEKRAERKLRQRRPR
jgi:hypothetical protein